MAEIRLDAPTKFRVIRTDDGRLHCEGAFCRDGILEYRQPDGSIVRELRRPETNADPKTIETFKLLPLVVEHPPVGLLSSKTYKDFTVGLTDSSAHYDSTSGVIKGLVSFFDAEAIAHIDAKEKEELSAGYTCDIKAGKGVWNGQEYDREQVNIRANHLALTSQGRAGEDVRLRLDSKAGIGQVIDPTSIGGIKKRMAAIRCDGVEYSDIPEAFASVAGSRFRELEELKPRFDSFQEKLETVTNQLKAIEQERQDTQIKIATLESIVSNADSVLTELGFQRNDSGQYTRTEKGKKKKHSMPFEEEVIEVEEEEEVEEDETFPPTKTKKKMKKTVTKTDSEPEEQVLEIESEIKKDSISDLLAAWKEADQLISGFSETKFDDAFSVADIKRTVLAELEPDLDLSTRSDSYVDGVFSRLKVTREDAKQGYTEQLNMALKSSPKNRDRMESLSDWDKQRCEAYKKPLTMSKSQLGAMK